MIDFDAARHTMIESQIRPNGITDQRLIAAMAAVPREPFVPAHLRSLAYMDEDVPLGAGEGAAARHLIEPMAFARLVQAAAIGPGDLVLDVGCASGYSAAVIARLAQSVIALDQDEALAGAANDTLARLGAANVAVVTGPHAAGYPAEGPYDAIVIEGRVPQVPPALLAQLKDGGRLVAVVGGAAVAHLLVYTQAAGTAAARHVHDASVSPLPGFPVDRPAFVF